MQASEEEMLRNAMMIVNMAIGVVLKKEGYNASV